MLSFAGTILLALSIAVSGMQVLGRLFFPQLVPRGVTTILLLILFFGSINLFAVGIVAEYIAKIFEEVKQRPHFIRRSIIKDGEVRSAADVSRPERVAP
jgi:dolichol-phosphate mannosyltransferase